MSNYSRPPHELALEHLIMATSSADTGNKEGTKHHLDEAKLYAECHEKRLVAQGQKKGSSEYMDQFGAHALRVSNLLNTRMNKSQCSQDHSKMTAKCQDCGYMIKTDVALEKGTGAMKQARWNVSKPPQDRRYDYRSINNLHSDDQMKVHHQYGNRDMGHYEYPVDKQTGRLAVANRAPSNRIEPPEARASSYQLKPEHKVGASVRINAPGEKHHGRLGIVHQPHPALPGKIPVQIGHSEHHKVYLEPHQLKPSRAVTKIEKALVSLYAIRKVFLAT